MKILVGCLSSAALLLATAAEAQMLPPVRTGVVAVSDFGAPGPYAAMPPRVYVPPPRYGYAPPEVLSPREVDGVLREAGYSPLGAPQQRGLVYTVAAIDLDGEDGRLVIDARSGRILRFMPAYRMGDRMNEEVTTLYGPESGLPPAPEMRRPVPPAAGMAPPQPAPERLASRTPAMVPLPKRAPVHAVATPAKPVAVEQPKLDAPVAAKAAEKPVDKPAEQPALTQAPAAPAPVQQSAAVETKPAEAPVAEPKPETVPAAPPPVIDHNPESAAPAGDKPPPVQGLE